MEEVRAKLDCGPIGPIGQLAARFSDILSNRKLLCIRK